MYHNHDRDTLCKVYKRRVLEYIIIHSQLLKEIKKKSIDIAKNKNDKTLIKQFVNSLDEWRTLTVNLVLCIDKYYETKKKRKI